MIGMTGEDRVCVFGSEQFRQRSEVVEGDVDRAGAYSLSR